MALEEKDCRISIRLTANEKKLLKKHCDGFNSTISDFVLAAIRDAMHAGTRVPRKTSRLSIQ